jgi:hypothetical protein
VCIILGPLFHHIREKFKRRVEDEKFPEKLRLHSTHDDTLFALLWGLGLDKPQMIRPGDGLIFELHNEKVGTDKTNENTVKVCEV